MNLQQNTHTHTHTHTISFRIIGYAQQLDNKNSVKDMDYEVVSFCLVSRLLMDSKGAIVICFLF